MLRNYCKLAWRNLQRHKFITGINLFGLTVGITCCLLILTYVLHELSYDRYHPEAENVYRVGRTFLNPQTKEVNLDLGTVAPPVAPLLQNDFPEIKAITRFLSNGTTALRIDDKRFNEHDAYFADEHLFDVFRVDLVRGNPARALREPYCLLLSEELAKKYFGAADPMNQVMRIDNQYDAKVTGVFKAFPSASHIHPQLLISFNTLRDTAVYGEERLRTNWGNNSFYTYLLLPPHYDAGKLEARFPAFLERHFPREKGPAKVSEWTRLNLTALTDIHLRSHTDLEAEENGDIKRVYIFSAIALFILLIACINYMNLSTARSVLRAKEIGVRKTLGAGKGELRRQFLIEAVLLSWIASGLAVLLTWLTLPLLNQLSGQTLELRPLLRPSVLLPLLALPFAVGLVSGFYPALFLSAFQPVKVLKGVMKVDGGRISLRKALVVVQFSISIILIISTAIVFRQLRYMQQSALGFDRDQVVTLPYTPALNESYNAFRTELLADPAIRSVGRSSRIPTGRLLDAQGAKAPHGDTLAPTTAEIKMLTADEGFLSTYNVKLVAGRNLRYDSKSGDTTAYLLNESAVKALGFSQPEKALGTPFSYGDRAGTIEGVFHDFHFESMHQRIVPLVVFLPPARRTFFGQLSVKVAGSNMQAALAHIEKTWRRFAPEIPFEYNFMDENFSKLYRSEERQAVLFTLFACIAIFIACLGLLGLSAFAISQRIREIGIRKVLGASVADIVRLLFSDFSRLVAVAALVAFPLAWLAMHRWLEDFAYRIQIPWWIFIAAGLAALAIAFVTISYQAVRAALSNPVKNLRTDS